jgi:adenylate cyclase
MTEATAPRGPSPSQRRYSRDEELQALEALESIAASGTLGTGDRLPALLAHVVREELAGRGDRIKGFSIATTVLGRGAGFDGQNDGIARAEMTRLRKALELYNARSPALDRARIEIPRGTFRPRISFPDPIEPGTLANPAPGTATPRKVAVILLLLAFAAGLLAMLATWNAPRPIESPPLLVMQPTSPGSGGISEALNAAVAIELARQRWLTVIRPAALPQIDQALREAVRTRPIYVLETQVEQGAGDARITTFLKRWPDQAVQWSHRYDASTLAGLSSEAVGGVALTIANDVSEPGGAIALAETARRDVALEDDQRFLCLMTVRLYWRAFDLKVRAEGQRCLEATLAADGGHWSSRAALALLKLEDARAASGVQRQRLLDEAHELTPDVEPRNMLLQTARMALAACRNDVGSLRAIAAKLLSDYPNNPDILADVGSKLGLVAGDWKLAVEVEAKAIALNPAPEPWYPAATLVRGLVEQRPVPALGLVARIPQRGFVTGHVMRLALAGAAGDRAVRTEAAAKLAALGLSTREQMDASIDGECWSDEAKRAVKAGVARALNSDGQTPRS